MIQCADELLHETPWSTLPDHKYDLLVDLLRDMFCPEKYSVSNILLHHFRGHCA